MAIMLGIIYLVLILGDFFSTKYAVSKWGYEVESNPVWQCGFKHDFRVMDWIFLIGAFVIGIGAHMTMGDSGLVVLIAMFGITNCNNMIAIIRMHRRDKRKERS